MICKQYKTPVGEGCKLFSDMASQPHLLIAGATGSGKSVVINGIIYGLIHKAPTQAQFIFIDPKRVELFSYKSLPHTIMYASEPDDMIAALGKAMDITEDRYKSMQGSCKKYTGSDVYVVIDELADLMTTQRRKVQPLLQRLCQIGRAARVHVISATQCPLAKVIPTEIKVNFDARVGLRTRCAQDSRNILGASGLETYPRYGECYFMTPEEEGRWRVPYITDEEIEAIVTFWRKNKPKTRFLFKKR